MKKGEYKTTIRLDQKMKEQLDDVFSYSHHHTKSDLIRHALFIGLSQIRTKLRCDCDFDKPDFNPTTKTTEDKS